MAIQHQVARLSDAELDRALAEAEKGPDGSDTYQLWLDCLRREKRVRQDQTDE